MFGGLTDDVADALGDKETADVVGEQRADDNADELECLRADEKTEPMTREPCVD